MCFFFLFFAFSFAAFSFDRFAPDLGAYSGAMAENGRMQDFENVLGLARAPRQIGVVAMAAICVKLKELFGLCKQIARRVGGRCD